MAQHTPITIDPQESARAEQTWHSFVKMGKIAIVHIIVIMGILLVVYLKTT